MLDSQEVSFPLLHSVCLPNSFSFRIVSSKTNPRLWNRSYNLLWTIGMAFNLVENVFVFSCPWKYPNHYSVEMPEDWAINTSGSNTKRDKTTASIMDTRAGLQSRCLVHFPSFSPAAVGPEKGWLDRHPPELSRPVQMQFSKKVWSHGAYRVINSLWSTSDSGS